MRLLLDTQVILWWATYHPRLTASALAHLRDPANTLHVIAVVGFEIATKAAIGKLTLTTTPDVLINTVMQNGGVQEVPLMLRHTYRVGQLPLIHCDSFDRLMIATALEEQMTLLTADQTIPRYAVPTIW